MLDLIYHMTLKLLLVCCFTSQATAMVMWGQSKLLIDSIFGLKMSRNSPSFSQHYNGRHYVMLLIYKPLVVY